MPMHIHIYVYTTLALYVYLYIYTYTHADRAAQAWSYIGNTLLTIEHSERFGLTVSAAKGLMYRPERFSVPSTSRVGIS